MNVFIDMFNVIFYDFMIVINIIYNLVIDGFSFFKIIVCFCYQVGSEVWQVILYFFWSFECMLINFFFVDWESFLCGCMDVQIEKQQQWQGKQLY